MTLRESPIVLIGPGKWGEALCQTLLENLGKGHPVFRLDAEDSWDMAFRTPPLCLSAVPFEATQSILQQLKPYKIAGLVNASKGIDRKTLLTFTSLAKKLRAPSATLSGPTFAQELAERRPTACVVASQDRAFAKSVAEIFSTSFFRPYVGSDPIGVEVCGAIKNVLAIACGISDGMNLGMNARAALLTRGLKEMEILAKQMGGKTASVYGLAGVGDLWLTATGDLSRNRQFGVQLTSAKSVDEARARVTGPVEGLYTVAQVHQIAKRKKLDLPISEQIYRICYMQQDPKKALHELMARKVRSES